VAQTDNNIDLTLYIDPKNHVTWATFWALYVFFVQFAVKPFVMVARIVLLGDRSRVCAVAQYAVLEANGKVNGIGEISNPYPSQILGLIWMLLQIYHQVRPGTRCANLIKIDSAVAALRMREKTRFRVGFLRLPYM